MKIGIDGNMWYCSNGRGLPDPNAQFTFEPTLREAIVKYQKEFQSSEFAPQELMPYLDMNPSEYTAALRALDKEDSPEYIARANEAYKEI